MPSSMYLQPQDMINLAIPIIYMGDGGEIMSFDGEDKLIVQSFIDWGLEKPKWGAYKGYYRWWVCWTVQGTGYTRQTLVWGTGLGRPGKSCGGKRGEEGVLTL